SREAAAAAANGDGFVVVWRDDLVGRFDANIYGALVRDATVVTPDVAISTASGQQRGPEVSSDGDGFFVVWRDARNFSTNDYDIYGARVSRSGVVLDTNGIVICSAPRLQAEAAVAFGGASYVVTWHNFRN